MIKTCNNCTHTWTAVVWACPRCGSIDLNYSEEKMLPIGIEYKTVDNDLKKWYKDAIQAIKKMPKEN